MAGVQITQEQLSAALPASGMNIGEFTRTAGSWRRQFETG
jgi:hypothetical protein